MSALPFFIVIACRKGFVDKHRIRSAFGPKYSVFTRTITSSVYAGSKYERNRIRTVVSQCIIGALIGAAPGMGLLHAGTGLRHAGRRYSRYYAAAKGSHEFEHLKDLFL